MALRKLVGRTFLVWRKFAKTTKVFSDVTFIAYSISLPDKQPYLLTSHYITNGRMLTP